MRVDVPAATAQRCVTRRGVCHQYRAHSRVSAAHALQPGGERPSTVPATDAPASARRTSSHSRSVADWAGLQRAMDPLGLRTDPLLGALSSVRAAALAKDALGPHDDDEFHSRVRATRPGCALSHASAPATATGHRTLPDRNDCRCPRTKRRRLPRRVVFWSMLPRPAALTSGRCCRGRGAEMCSRRCFRPPSPARARTTRRGPSPGWSCCGARTSRRRASSASG